MKKTLLTLNIAFAFIACGSSVYAQTGAANVDWACINGTTAATGTTSASYTFTGTNCPAANGFSAETVGTVTVRVFGGTSGSTDYLRLDKTGATSTFSYARLYSTSGTTFTLTTLSVSSSSSSVSNPQTVTVHAYKNGIEMGTAITMASQTAFAFLPVTITSNFQNIDEVRFTCSGPTPFGVAITNLSTASTATPITWVAFDVTEKNSFYNWEWTLGTEENVAYYSPQYSINGTDFIDAGKVTDLNATHKYQFGTDLAIAGNAFFRVKEVDKDGSTLYSQVRFLENTNAAKDVSYYPNPAASFLNMQWPYSEAKTVHTVIMSGEGKIVKEQDHSMASLIRISLSGLAAGKYYIYSTDDKQHTSSAKQFYCN